MEASNLPAQAPAGLDETRMTVRGVGLPVLQAGPREAREAVVFVHGNPGSGEDWRSLVEQAGGFARAVAPDMPGFGRADKPRDFPYSVSGYADFLDGVLEELGIDRVHLVVHDFGGPWGMEWAARNPSRVASAVLINTGVLIGYRWHILARIWRTPVLGEVFQGTATRPLFRLLTNLGQKRKLPRSFLDHAYDVNFTRADPPRGAEALPRDPRSRWRRPSPGRGAAPPRHPGARRLGRARPLHRGRSCVQAAGRFSTSTGPRVR